MHTEHRSTLPTFLTRYGTFILHVADPPVMTDCQAVVVVAQSSAMPATDWRADCVLYCAKHTQILICYRRYQHNECGAPAVDEWSIALSLLQCRSSRPTTQRLPLRLRYLSHLYYTTTTTSINCLYLCFPVFLPLCCPSYMVAR